jgi:threonyl-tRNA synthetase
MEPEKLAHLRHTLSHLLAAAVLELYPDAKPTLGPAIDNGFYYDIQFTEPPKDADLAAVEKMMRKLLPSWKEFAHREVSRDEALKLYADNPFKQELINEIADTGEPITLYTAGDFTDLCRGGHVEHPNTDIPQDGFKLSHIAGAYWRGDEKNPMLTRIYGLAFESKDALDAYEAQQEKAKKRDHRKIGQEQDLFFIDDMVGKGLVMWLPNGTIIRDEVEKLAVEKEKEYGYIRVVTPHIAKEQLYLTSGHLPYYKDSMYPAMEMDDGVYYLRAMNCPHHHRIYLHKPHSYRELPVRIAEYGTVYRNELSGTLAGLLRVRGLAMNDAHIYCRKDQIKEEFKNVLKLVMEYFGIFGFTDYSFRLSKWDPAHTEKYINEPENWNHSESVLREVLEEMQVPFVEAENEAAFYGPKVDVQFKSVTGREESLSTIQLDFLAKERFGLSYTDMTGNKNTEVFVIHRAPLSTHERFLAVLIEHYAGAFPLWLSPVQIRVLPVSEKHAAYAQEITAVLKDAGIRVALDDSNETLGKKIRSWKIEKDPYALVIGDKEKESGRLTLESRTGEKKEIALPDLIASLQEEIAQRRANH